MYFVALLALLAAPTAAAGDIPVAADRYVVERWTTADGLPQNSVTGLEQDRDGYLWVATFGGLARYDGERFHVFEMDRGLDVARFMSVFEADDGALWIGTESRGVVRYRGGAFEAVETPQAALGAPIEGFAQARGAVWAATRAGPVVWREDAAEVVPHPAGAVRDIGADDDGRVWAASEAGVRCVAGCDGVSTPAVEGATHRIAFDGSALVAMGLGGFERQGPAPVRLAFQDGSWTGDIAVDARTGRTWFARGDALFVLEADRAERVPLPWSQGGYVIRSLELDRQGQLWVGSDGDGLFMVRDRQVIVHGRLEGLSEPAVRTVLADGDVLWVGSGCEVLLRFEGGAFTSETLPPRSGCVRALATGPDGDLWFGSGPTVFRREAPGRHREVATAGWGSMIYALVLDGARWLVGTSGGLYELPTSGGDLARVPGTEGVEDVRAISIHGDAIWVGTSDGVSIVEAGSVRSLTGRDGLSRGAVRDVLIDPDGTAWVGTYGGGLSRVSGDRIDRFGRAEGLCDLVVSRILDGGDGALWMNGNRGIQRVARSDFEAVLSGRRTRLDCRLLDSGEGNGGAQPAGSRGPDGRLWFPTIAGVAEVDPSRLTFASVPPLVHIQSATLDGEQLRPGAVLPAGRGDLVVEAIGVALPRRTLRFEHRLLGADERWVASRGSTLRYLGLPPGDYAVEVRVLGEDREPSPVARLPFTLTPALHQRRWFPFAAGGLLLVLVSALWWTRIRRLRRHARELQAEIDARTRLQGQLRQVERVEMLGTLAGGVAHDFNNILMAVGGTTELLAMDLDGTPHLELVDEIREAVDRGTALATRMLSFSRVGESNPDALDPAEVLDALRPLMARVLPAGVGLDLRAPTGLRIVADRLDLEQALMNLVVNARDALDGQGTIDVVVRKGTLPEPDARARGLKGGDYVIVQVSDDGPGMDADLQERVFTPFFTTKAAGEGTGLGLATVARAVQGAGGFVRLESEVGRGSTFELWFPAPP